MEKVSILGVGSYGMALADLLSQKPVEILMWSHEASISDSINERHRNPYYLQEITLRKNVRSTILLEETLEDCDYLIIVLAIPFLRNILSRIAKNIPEKTLIINGSKGLETKSLKSVSEILAEILPPSFQNRCAFVSGPSFAREIAQKKFTAVIVASSSEDSAKRVKKLFSTSFFQVFLSEDVIGVELCGSLKNIMAIAAGLVDGLELGFNARAALITGGLVEITRIGLKKGAKLQTFVGLAGVGDLFLTCTGDLSRNRYVGQQLALGRKIQDILQEMKMVAEGIKTTASAYQIAKKLKLRVPIIEEIYQVLYQEKPAQQAIQDLLSQELYKDWNLPIGL